tara:strand:+ start:92 stop:292 length:201 start_codon:yes stop_codon:yes gene_type:complete
MGKMKELYTLAMESNEEKIYDLLSTKMSKGAARYGASEFVKAANELKKDKKKPLFTHIEESDSTEL